MRSDELLLNLILRRELGVAREISTRTWHFLLRSHCALKMQDGAPHWSEPSEAPETSTRCSGSAF